MATLSLFHVLEHEAPVYLDWPFGLSAECTREEEVKELTSDCRVGFVDC